MSDTKKILNSEAARTYYDRFGKKQDTQSFYEDPALNDLVANANFEQARYVFEFGCGTGKFAARLLKQCLHPSARYLGCDISRTMINLTKERLKAFSKRAQAILTDGTIEFPIQDHSVDRVVSNYVLDLLSASDIHRFFSEAFRVLEPGGLLCIASLTKGINIQSRIVSSVWELLFRLNPVFVGGCRPIMVHSFVNQEEWQILHQKVLTPYGVPSEVLVLKSRYLTDSDTGSKTI